MAVLYSQEWKAINGRENQITIINKELRNGTIKIADILN